LAPGDCGKVQRGDDLNRGGGRSIKVEKKGNKKNRLEEKQEAGTNQQRRPIEKMCRKKRVRRVEEGEGVRKRQLCRARKEKRKEAS